MNAVVYDAGPLVAADRGDRRFWADHRVRLELGVLPCVSSIVVAQVSRSARQADLRRLLRGCEIVPFDEAAAHRVGALLAKTHTSDVADAAVVDLARVRRADIVTGDSADIERLVAASGARLRIRGLLSSRSRLTPTMARGATDAPRPGVDMDPPLAS